MATTEKFCLKWNDFEANIGVAFRELREDKDFFDVTLACEDDQIEAHKMILASCSPFFRNILRKNPHPYCGQIRQVLHREIMIGWLAATTSRSWFQKYSELKCYRQAVPRQRWCENHVR